MRSWARALALGFSMLVAVPPGAFALAGTGGGPSASGADAFASGVMEGPLVVRMKAGTFDPTEPFAAAPAPLMFASAPSTNPAGSDGRVRFILQFGTAVNPDLIATLGARGLEYERYLPDRGMIAAAYPSDVPASPSAVGARAMLPLHPAFRLDPSLWSEAVAPGPEDLRVTVALFQGSGNARPLARLATILAFDGRIAIADTAASDLLALARLGDVEWVERYAFPHPLLNYTTRLMHARQTDDGPFAGGPHAVWSYNPATQTFEGLNGTGVTINIADTGIDGSHPTFAGRIVAGFGYGDNATCDCSPNTYPHGTLVAGIAAGNGSWRPQDSDREPAKFAGVAPGANLVAQMIWSALRTPAQYSQDAYSAGAFVNSNSWGGEVKGSYTLDSQEYDALVLDANGREPGAPQMVYVFAAGNDGPGDQTIDTPGTAKNVITVGATGNLRWSSPDDIAGFSSRGPAADGRLKPDLVAPGDGVDSARAQDAGCGGGEDNCSYWPNSGTSLSTPAVSGAAALTTQWYRNTFSTSPSAAMVKALLIAGTAPMANYPWPDNNQGWGMVDLAQTVREDASSRHLVWDEGPALAQISGRTTANFSFLAEPFQEVRIVLVWSDVPGTSSSAKALINDLDLEVRAPDGTLLLGNVFSQGRSTAGGTADSGNNTEVVRVLPTQRGVWRVTVRASSIPSGDQRFALVAAGNITSSWVSLAPSPVEFLPPLPREGDLLTVVIPVRNNGTRTASAFRVEAELSGPQGTSSASANVLGILPGDDFPATFTFSPLRGTQRVRVTVDPGGTSGDAFASDNAAEATVFVRGFEVELTALQGIAGVPPLGSDTFLAEVTNAGNTVDTVSVSAAVTLGWSVDLNLSTRALAPGESGFVSGTVHAPDRALEGQVGSVVLTAASAGNTSRRATLTFDIPVSAAPSSQIVQERYFSFAGPGDTVTFPYRLTNAGNVPLRFTLAPSFVPSAPAGWSATPGGETITLQPYSGTDRASIVQVPLTAVASQIATLRVSITSEEEGLTQDLVFQVAVNRTYGAEVAALTTASAGLPGDFLSFPVGVRNLGNGRESFTVTAVPDGGAVGLSLAVENASLSVPPFGEGYATVNVALRSYAPQGRFTAQVRVEGEDRQAHLVGISVEVYAVHLVGASAPARVSVRQGGTATAVITIENDGNLDEPIGLLVTALPPGLTVDGWSGTRTLPRGERTTVELRMSAAVSAPLGAAQVTLSLSPLFSDTFSAVNLTIPVDVREGAKAASAFAPAFEAAPAVALIALAAHALNSRAGGAPRGPRQVHRE